MAWNIGKVDFGKLGKHHATVWVYEGPQGERPANAVGELQPGQVWAQASECGPYRPTTLSTALKD